MFKRIVSVTVMTAVSLGVMVGIAQAKGSTWDSPPKSSVLAGKAWASAPTLGVKFG